MTELLGPAVEETLSHLQLAPEDAAVARLAQRYAAAIDAMAAPLAGDPPPPPGGLLKRSRDRWEGFWRSPAAAAVNVDADLGRLHRWIQAVDEYERTGDLLRKSRLVRNSAGLPVLNPLVGYLAQLEATIRAAEDAFGMTPASQQRLQATPLAAETLDRFGPKLLAALGALGATPAARAKRHQRGGGNAGPNRLAQLRAAHRS